MPIACVELSADDSEHFQGGCVSNVDTPKTITCIEWCFGYGGNHLGLRRVIPNLRCIAASEIEAYACANLVAKMEAGQLEPFPIWTDLKTFPCEQFRGVGGLADSAKSGLQGRGLLGRPAECRPFFWPGFIARPGQEQHAWEPSRTIETKRGLGGGVDGRAANVDRLRLLGNGVYPATAAKAFCELMRRFKV
jgi:hypothetical protein